MPKLHGLWEFRFVREDFESDRKWVSHRIGDLVPMVGASEAHLVVRQEVIDDIATMLDQMVETARRTIMMGSHVPTCQMAKGGDCGCLARLEYLQGKTRTTERTLLIRIEVG